MSEAIRITIDGINLHHTLENEHTIQEVITQIHTWLESNQRIAASISINGRPYDAELMGETTIAQISKLEVTTTHPHELSIRRLNLLQDILYILEDAHKKGDAPALKNFKKNSSEITELFQSTFPEEPSHDFLTYDAAYFSYVLTLIEERRNEFLDPLQTGMHTAKILLAHMERLSDLPVMLQTGRERNAMNLLIMFSEHTRRLIRVYLIAKTRYSTLGSEEFSKLHHILSELEEALNNEDSVLIGDLIEYELIPQCRENITNVIEEFSTAEQAPVSQS